MASSGHTESLLLSPGQLAWPETLSWAPAHSPETCAIIQVKWPVQQKWHTSDTAGGSCQVLVGAGSRGQWVGTSKLGTGCLEQNEHVGSCRRTQERRKMNTQCEGCWGAIPLEVGCDYAYSSREGLSRVPRGPKGPQQLEETCVYSNSRVRSRRGDLVQSGVTLVPTSSYITTRDQWRYCLFHYNTK